MYKEPKLSLWWYRALHSRLLTFETAQHNSCHLVNTVLCMCISVCKCVSTLVCKLPFKLIVTSLSSLVTDEAGKLKTLWPFKNISSDQSTCKETCKSHLRTHNAYKWNGLQLYAHRGQMLLSFWYLKSLSCCIRWVQTDFLWMWMASWRKIAAGQ